jgi:predicted O-methyltransferase YrrM
LLAEGSAVDIFIHDSDHSYDHMHWEFEQVWPLIRPGGLLLSDDILGNQAFDDFVHQYEAHAYKLGNMGGIVKPPR